MNVQKIAQGQHLPGIIWEIDFITNDIDYHWEGQIEEHTKFGSTIKVEKLTGNNFIFEHELGEVKINEVALPVQLNPFQSIVTLFQQDDRIKPIFDGFKRIEILTIPHSMSPQQFEPDKAEEIIKGFTSLVAIQNSDYPIHTKLIMVRFNLPDIFLQIKEDYIAIFPQLQNIGIIKIMTGAVYSDAGREIPSLSSFEFSFEEVGVDIQVRQQDISTGMLKTLLLIGAVYLSPPGTVILIDEFENSLGVNCIDIFDQIPYENRGLQFIITSHHPQIISSIPMEYWKIVTRHGSTVTVHKAKEFKRLNASKLDPFVQLINLPEYSEGVTTP